MRHYYLLILLSATTFISCGDEHSNHGHNHANQHMHHRPVADLIVDDKTNKVCSALSKISLA